MSCTNLKKVKLEKGTEEIGSSVFGFCSSLTDIQIPEGVTVLGDGAFRSCTQLTSAEIPSSIKNMSADVFVGCPGVTIWGQAESFARSYASANKTPFRILGSDRETIRLDANGGTGLSSDSLEVVENGTYGKLPDAVREGYLFDGWYTAAEGGIRITEKSLVKFPWEPVLYAHWTKISVKKVSLQKPVNQRSSKMKLKWKKVSGADGYEILYAANKKMRKPKLKTTAGKTLIVKKLKKGKTYYAKVRAYRLDSAGKKIYGAYSKKQKVKIKK